MACTSSPTRKPGTAKSCSEVVLDKMDVGEIVIRFETRPRNATTR